MLFDNPDRYNVSCYQIVHDKQWGMLSEAKIQYANNADSEFIPIAS